MSAGLGDRAGVIGVVGMLQLRLHRVRGQGFRTDVDRARRVAVPGPTDQGSRRSQSANTRHL